MTLDIEHWPGRSEIKKMNSKGPSIEPCGTPLEMDFCVEKVESTRTLKVRSIKKFFIHSRRVPLTPAACNFNNSNSCGTVSKALKRSKYSTSTQ